MMNNQEKIEIVEAFINEINKNEYFSNEQDVRNITQYALYQCTENFLFALLQVENFFKLDQFRIKIDNNTNEEDVEIKKYNYEGFINSAYFNSFFVIVETHIRHIASHYENSNNKIEVISIKSTFENLTNPNKTTLFNNLDSQEKDVFNFFCYLRNTIHNIGFHSDNNPIQRLIIQDLNSQITTYETELILEPGQANNIGLKKILLLNEQVFNLIMKMNKLIPNTDFIKHKLDEIGFND